MALVLKEKQRIMNMIKPNFIVAIGCLCLLGLNLNAQESTANLQTVEPCTVYQGVTSVVSIKAAVEATKGTPCHKEFEDKLMAQAKSDIDKLNELGATAALFESLKELYKGTIAEPIVNEASKKAITVEQQSEEILAAVKAKAKQGNKIQQHNLEEQIPAEEAVAEVEEAKEEVAAVANTVEEKETPMEDVTTTEVAATEVAAKEAESSQPKDERFEEEVVWQMAIDENKLDGYKGYLEKYPEGVHASEAAEKLKTLKEEARVMELAKDEATWINAEQVNTIDEYKKYLGTYPEGRHAQEAKDKLKAMGEDTLSREDKILLLAKDEALWMRTREKGTIKAYEEYLKQYPEGRHSEYAKKTVESLKDLEVEKKMLEKARDEVSWKVAVATNTLAAYEEYLKLYPNGIYAAQAKKKVDELKE